MLPTPNNNNNNIVNTTRQFRLNQTRRSEKSSGIGRKCVYLCARSIIRYVWGGGAVGGEDTQQLEFFSNRA